MLPSGKEQLYKYQVAQRIVEISLIQEMGLVNNVLGTIWLSDDIIAKVGDESAKDTL